MAIKPVKQNGQDQQGYDQKENDSILTLETGADEKRIVAEHSLKR